MNEEVKKKKRMPPTVHVAVAQHINPCILEVGLSPGQ